MLEKLNGYKTVIVFGLVLLNGIARQLGWGLELPGEWQEATDILLAAIALVLRFVTKTSVFKSQ